MDPVSLLSEKGLDFVLGLLVQELGYLLCYRDKENELNRKVEHLKSKQLTVRKRIDDGEKSGDVEILPDVVHWLREVDEKLTDIQEVWRRTKTKSSNYEGFIPYLFVRHQLGRKAVKLAKDADDLLNASQFKKVSCRPDTPRWAESVFSVNGLEGFESRTETVEKIIKELEDSSVRAIGICGQGGVGKTTLVKEVANIAREMNLFTLVVIANIGRNPQIKNIQGQIADMLGMTLVEETDIGRAGQLRERLKKDKENTLVILDDLWDGLDLNKLGVPIHSDDSDQKTMKNESAFPAGNRTEKEKSGDNYGGCKILLTSRKKEVLSTEMDVKENSIISVELLKEEEAEIWFKKVTGVQDKNSELDSLASKIAKKCAGLPMALITVGKALRNKSSVVWNDALRQLERQEFTGVQESMEISTKLSYDYLENEELKATFLLCAQMGNDSLIVDLLKYSIGLGILEGVYTIKEVRGKLEASIGILKDSNLLLNSYSSDCFTMHDIVRDAALSIAFKEKHAFIKRYIKLDNWLDEDELEKYTTISLRCCEIVDELPKSINCPKLKMFHVESEDHSLTIPDKFFKRMTKLRVLVLIGINLSHVPSSIQCLKSLRMLCLEKCEIGEGLSLIRWLKKLRIVCFSGSVLKCFPPELGHNLQFLDISNCSMPGMIPPNVISCSRNLEELYMRNNLVPWKHEGNRDESLAELSHLHQLTTIDIHIPDINIFPENVFFHTLDCYKITIGDFRMFLEEGFKMPDQHEASRTLALQLEEGNKIHSQNRIKLLFKTVKNLLLGKLKGVENIFHEMCLLGFSCLKHLYIANNNDIDYIIKSMNSLLPLKVFPVLESLHLYKLARMKTICCSDHLTESSFCNLKIVKIKMCRLLKNIFSFSMVGLLKKLETIEVSECEVLKEIVKIQRQVDTEIEVGDDVIDKVEFPQLQHIILQKLSAFTGFYTNKMLLFSEKVKTPKLESLEISSIKISHIWSNMHASDSSNFQYLIRLNISGCGNMKYLLSFSTAVFLVKLKILHVSECNRMEKLLTPEDSTSETEDHIFPNLKEIKLSHMQNLTEIWHKSSNQAGSNSYGYLESVVITKCNKLVTVFPSHMIRMLKSLNSLVVATSDSVEVIFDIPDIPPTDYEKDTGLQKVDIFSLHNLKHVWNKDPKGILNFKNLQDIRVSACDGLENLFPFSVAIGLKQLESLQIMSCEEMEHIVGSGNGSNTESVAFEFPTLTSVKFSELHKLRSIYQGIHNIDYPELKNFELFDCDKLVAFTEGTLNPERLPIFSEEAQLKVMPNLQSLVFGNKEANLLSQIVNNYPLMSLKKLHLQGLKNDEFLFGFLNRTPNLEELDLWACDFKELLLAEQGEIGTVVQLKSLSLISLHSLHNIGFEQDQALFQLLQRLTIIFCHCLTNLAPGSVCFTHLTDLQVAYCDRLKYLIESSTAKSLSHLTTLEVARCKMMEEIVSKGETRDAGEDEIVLHRLTTLKLDSLNKLISFCSSKYCSFMFPLLENMVVKNCPEMKRFSESVAKTPKLRKVYFAEGEDEGKWYWSADLNETIQIFFTNMIAFKEYHSLDLRGHPQLQQLWHGKVPLRENSFTNLRSLVVANCEFLSTVIPCHLLPYLKNLKNLNVESCSLVEKIFDISDIKSDEILFHLEDLSLEKLPNLKNVCDLVKNTQGFFSIQDLKKVRARSCQSLNFLFPASLAENLTKLESLYIKNCEEMKEIVGKDEAEADGAIFKFKFPRLISLTLIELFKLKCFYPGKHDLKCPMLKSFRVFHCGILDIFTQELQSNQEVPPEDNVGSSTNEHSLYSLHQKVIPKLENLTLDPKDTMMLSRKNFLGGLYKTKKLVLQCFHNVDQGDTSLYRLLNNIPNVDTLKVLCSSFKVIFPSQKVEVSDAKILAQLRQLNLEMLPGLKSIGLEHSWIDHLCYNLQVLEVSCCNRLTTLVQSAVAFCSLEELSIVSCQGLKYLFTSSTAKSLVQLKKMYINSSKSIKEIVAKEEDDSSLDEIRFGKLELLSLKSLSSLLCFYTRNTTLNFPSLEEVYIRVCPKMKNFSQGIINVPKLESRRALNWRDASCWDTDLNTTIVKLLNENVSLEEIVHMKLWEYPEAEKIWRREVPLPKYCFFYLQTLTVENCDFLLKVIPSHIVTYLKNLKKLQVKNCVCAKVIFDINDLDMAKFEEVSFSFSLEILTLDRLPNLKHVWSKDTEGIVGFANLQEVQVTNCKHLKTLFTTSLSKNLGKLEKLTIESCDEMKEIVEKDKEAVEGISAEFVFPQLTLLVLSQNPELKFSYAERHNLICSNLKYLRVYGCDKLAMFILDSQSYQEGQADDHQGGISVNAQPLFSIQKVLPKLEEVSLNVKEAMMLWREELGEAPFRSIKCLQLYGFHNVSETGTLPFGFLLKVPNMETLAIACSEFKEIFPSRRLEDDHIRKLAQLKGLRLVNLSKLSSIGLEHSWQDQLSENLEALQIWICPHLTNIVQSAVSFLNLRKLHINQCHGLECLFTSSTAKSLVRLKELCVEKCGSMKEIVAKEEGESTQDEIILGQLLKISLYSLPSLTSFYPGNSSLKLPSLHKVIVTQCPKMKIFSYWPISAPVVMGIQTSLEEYDKWYGEYGEYVEYDLHWEGDLNSTIEQLFLQKGAIVV